MRDTLSWRKHNQPPWLDWYLLDEDADEELLALMARDTGDCVHYGTSELSGGEFWRREQARNPMPYRLYVARRELRQKAEQERRQKQRATLRAKRELERAAREAENARLLAAMADEARRHWLSLFEIAAESVRGTKYAVLLPDLERDIATIRDHPPGPLPWRLDPSIFWRELARRKAGVDSIMNSALDAG